MLKPALILAAAASALTIAACNTSPRPPDDKGVCYQVTLVKDGPPKFNKVDDNVDIIENCVGRLEALRVKFLRMGGSRQELIGAYQGKFIFIDRAGVAFSDSLTGGRFFAFTRAPGGMLVIPGAVYAGEDQGALVTEGRPEQK